MTVAELIKELMKKRQDATILVGMFDLQKHPLEFNENPANEVIERYADSSTDEVIVLIY